MKFFDNKTSQNHISIHILEIFCLLSLVSKYGRRWLVSFTLKGPFVHFHSNKKCLMQRIVHRIQRKIPDWWCCHSHNPNSVAPLKQIQQFSHYKCFSCQIISQASLTVKLMNEKKKQIKKICSNDSTEIIKVEILGFSVTSNKMWDISCNLMAW